MRTGFWVKKLITKQKYWSVWSHVSSTKWLFTTALYILETGTKADGIIGDTDVLVQPILCEEYYVPHEVPHRYYQFGTPTNLQQVAQVGTYIF